jgi:hypothetical protein
MNAINSTLNFVRMMSKRKYLNLLIPEGGFNDGFGMNELQEGSGTIIVILQVTRPGSILPT